eukprot:tig00001496_g9199.t1
MTPAPAQPAARAAAPAGAGDAGLAPHQRAGIDVAREADVVPAVGLSEEAAASLLAKHTAPIILILYTALIISATTHGTIDAIVIGLVIAFNVGIGYVQEFRSEKTLAALKKATSPITSARVLRGGREKDVSTDHVVPGDVVLLEEGNQVPCDVRLLSVAGLECDEALLTGESAPVRKTTEAIASADIPLGDRKNMAYKNSIVTRGRGTGIAVGTGMQTELGRIAEKLTPKKVTTPLQRRMNYLGYALFAFAILCGIVVFAVNKFQGNLQKVALYAISVGIAIIPEGLVAVMTVTMAIGVRRMAQKKAIVRKLNSLEALGAVTDICSDKTGTLTQGKMVAVAVQLPDPQPREFEVEAAGVVPEGVFSEGGVAEHNYASGVKSADPALGRLLACAALCNNATVHKAAAVAGAKPSEAAHGWATTGDPTEVALQVLAMKGGVKKEALLRDHYGPQLCQYDFDATLKRMTTVFRSKSAPGGPLHAFAKGAAEVILGACSHRFPGDAADMPPVPVDEAFVSRTLARVEKLASRGLRVLALARREIPATEPVARAIASWARKNTHGHAGAAGADVPPVAMAAGAELEGEGAELPDRALVEGDLTFIGLVGIYDPPRPETASSVAVCQRAGITVHMVTGDHALTVRPPPPPPPPHAYIFMATAPDPADPPAAGPRPPRDIQIKPICDRTATRPPISRPFAQAAAIAAQVGIIGEDPAECRRKGLVMTASEFDKLTTEQEDALPELPLVVARCSPDSKVKLVDALKRRGRYVAMTGDGVNDAPSIMKADVGVAMGLGGSDVTKEAADIVLTDDNFASIVAAVEDGRRIFANLAKFIVHLLAGDVAETVALVIGLCFGKLHDAAGEEHLIYPMTAIQILWLNMVTGTPADIALGMEEASPDLMLLIWRTGGL